MKPPLSRIKTAVAIFVWGALSFCGVEARSGAPAAAPAAWKSSQRQVILADEIARSGLWRLGDLVLLFDGWVSSTIDGFARRSSARGLDEYQTASWMVMVDGVRIDTGEFGADPLALLPIHVGDIDSVEVSRVPGMHHGQFAGGGLIHIHTRRAAPGPRVQAAVSSGNEAGDPGPWAYTEYATPNVDRIGPTYALGASYGAEKAGVDATYLRDTHYPTDEAVRARTFGIAAGGYPRIAIEAASGRLSGRFLGGSHAASFSASRLEDFFFFKPYGREIPVTRRLAIGALAGSVPIAGPAVLEYRLVHTRSSLDYRANTPGIDFDWSTRTWVGGVGLVARTSSLRHRYDVEYERVNAVTGYRLSDRNHHLVDFRAEWESIPRGRFSHRAGAALTRGEGGFSFGAAGAERWRLNGGNRLELAVSYAERRPERDGRIWYRRERGYAFLDDIGVNAASEEPLGVSQRWTADLEWSTRLNRAVSGSLSGYYRNFSDLRLEEQRFAFDPGEQAFSGPITLLPGVSGAVAGGEAVAEARPSPRLRLRAAYRYERPVSGGVAFRGAWDAVPRHVWRQSARYAIDSNLALSVRLNWTGASRWRDYEDAEVQTGGVYRPALDGVFTLDAALTKWFWQRRLKGSLRVTSPLGGDARRHPVGASFDTTVYAGAELVLGPARSGASSRLAE